MRSGRADGKRLFKSKKRPTAMIATNDMMAFGLIESVRELKIEEGSFKPKGVG